MSFKGLTTFWLSFGVTMKVCTSCLWVLHLYWVHSVWMTLGCVVMDIHMGSDFLIDCLTLYGCLCGILHWNLGVAEVHKLGLIKVSMFK